MKAKTLRRLVSVLAALVMAVSLLAGCGTKTAEQVQEQEDAMRKDFRISMMIPPFVSLYIFQRLLLGRVSICTQPVTRFGCAASFG